MKGTVIKSTGSWYQIRTDSGEQVNGRLKGKFKLQEKKVTNPLAVGDQVQIQPEEKGDDTWIITDIIPRHNYVIRKSVKKTEHSHIIAANVDQVLILATLNQPRTSLGFIDRILVTAETYRIPSLVVWNKADLLDDDGIAEVDYYIDLYKNLGYESVLISALHEGDIQDSVQYLEGKTTLIVGHSGVGKSTFLNQLIPDLNQKTSGVSSFANKGVHTTTFAEMFTMNNGTFVIDTPGIKELGLGEIYDEELGHYFPEMRSLLGHCKFHNCTHIHEPKCAIQAAVESGEIAVSRFHSYLSMFEEEDTHR